MGEMGEATTRCSNCQRPIAASNYVIHTLHCQRNLMKCEKCGEAVPRSGLEEHDQELHSTVNCPDCHAAVERPHLDSHKKTVCRARQQGCLYCELEMPASDINEHENYCGSRTKKCEECGEYVMLKYEQLHIDSNHGFLKLDDEPGPTATWIKNDIAGGSRPAKANNHSQPRLTTGKFLDEEDDVDDVHSLFANLLKQKAVASSTHYPGVAHPISGEAQRFVSRSPPPFQEVQGDPSDLVALPCEFCEAMIPVNQLILHQTGCRMDVASFAKAKKSQNDSSKKKNVSSFERMNDLWEDSREKRENADSFDSRESRRNAVVKAGKVKERNAIGECNVVDMRRNAIDEGSEASLKHELEEDGIYFLPCEFCDEGYPPSLLLEHQDVCEYNPKNISEAAPVWSESQDVPSGRSKETLESLRPGKFEECNYNTFVDSGPASQANSSTSRGKNNISNSYNDLRGNFTVASEWSDDSDSRPTSATGAIPKQKAGKLNFSRKVNQEVQSSRPSNSLVSSNSRKVNSSSDNGQRYHIRNNLKDLNDDADDD